MKMILRVCLFALFSVSAGALVAGELVGTEAVRERLYPNVVEPERIIGGYGSRPSEFLQIRKVVFRDNQRFYVSDCGANRIQEFNVSGELLSTISHECPGDIAVSGRYLAVLSDLTGTVSLYENSGKFVRAWKVPRHGDKRVAAIAADASHIIVAPQYGGQLVVFDLYGRTLRHIDVPPIARVSGAVAAGNDIFLTDKFGARIYAINMHSGKVRHFGEFGTYAGEMANPHGIDVKNGKVYVVDTVNHRVQQFDESGAYRLQFGRHPVTPNEIGSGRMHYPHHIAVTPDGKWAVVCEPFESRCNLFLTGKVEQKYTSSSESA